MTWGVLLGTLCGWRSYRLTFRADTFSFLPIFELQLFF